MRTYYFRIRRGHLRDCNSVRKVYRRGILLLLYNYKVKGVRIRPSERRPTYWKGQFIDWRNPGNVPKNRALFAKTHVLATCICNMHILDQ